MSGADLKRILEDPDFRALEAVAIDHYRTGLEMIALIEKRFPPGAGWHWELRGGRGNYIVRPCLDPAPDPERPEGEE